MSFCCHFTDHIYPKVDPEMALIEPDGMLHQRSRKRKKTSSATTTNATPSVSNDVAQEQQEHMYMEELGGLRYCLDNWVDEYYEVASKYKPTGDDSKVAREISACGYFLLDAGADILKLGKLKERNIDQTAIGKSLKYSEHERDMTVPKNTPAHIHENKNRAPTYRTTNQKATCSKPNNMRVTKDPITNQTATCSKPSTIETTNKCTNTSDVVNKPILEHPMLIQSNIFSCAICGKVFLKKNAFSKHLKSHLQTAQ